MPKSIIVKREMTDGTLEDTADKSIVAIDSVSKISSKKRTYENQERMYVIPRSELA